MQTIILKVKKDNDISLLLHLAKRLGISIVTNTEKSVKSSNNSDLFSLLHKYRNKYELFNSISNPGDWQKEIRKDRVLLNRE